MSKKCFKCNTVKELAEFYPHKRMKDGHLNKCRECTKRDVAERYSDPDSRKRIAEYDKSRFQNPERKRKLLEYARASRVRNPMKAKARYLLGNAVRDGRIARMPCEICGDVKSEAHHHDYSKPLDVRWLCFKHHREVAHGQKVLTQ